MAKMLKEEDNRQSQEDPHHLKPSHRYRHWSLNELNQRHDSEIRAAKMRKWNSLSNDELINSKHSLNNNTRAPHFRAGQDGETYLGTLCFHLCVYEQCVTSEIGISLLQHPIALPRERVG